MIRRLRNRHRAAFGALATVLPIVFAAALFLRPRAPEAAPDLLRNAVDVQALGLPAGPDTLLYWSARAPAPDGALPAGARLVDGGDEAALADERSGYWITYSLGHARVTGSRAVALHPEVAEVTR